MKLLQREVAEQIGVETTSLFHWEANAGNPGFEHMPAIIRILGYNPLPPANGIGEQFVRHRTTMGFSQKVASSKIGVDPTTLAHWERGEKEPTGKLSACVGLFLRAAEVTLSRGRRDNSERCSDIIDKECRRAP